MEMKMKYNIIFLTFGIAIFIAGCAKLDENIAEPKALTVHKPGIMNPHDTLNFHGDLIKRQGWSMENCKQCHAANFSGGTAKESCLKCHTGAQGPLSCNTCHGNFSTPAQIAPPRGVNGETLTTYKGVGAHYNHLYGSTLGNVSCLTCHIVPSSVYAPGHLDSGLPAEVLLDSLAKYNIAANASYNSADAKCSNTYCHGNFEYTQANAPAERKYAYIGDKISGNNKTVQWTKVDGTEATCGSCHGLPPSGHIAVAANQCVSCHPTVVDENLKIIDKSKHMNGQIDYGVSDNAPCNACHGDPNDPSKIAPPRAVNGQTVTTYRGVGAHANHLYTDELGTVQCSNCHTVPSSVNAPGHIDSGVPAEVLFNAFVKNNIAINAAYNPSNVSCSNTYCHGNFEFTKDSAPSERKFAYTSDKMTGNNKTVQWTKVDGSEAACGTCHGLPPTGHIAVSSINQCVSCHPTVIDENGKIIDNKKHMNGKIDYGPYNLKKRKLE